MHSRTDKPNLVSIRLTLTLISSHMIYQANTKRHAYMHTNTLIKSCFNPRSAVLLKPHIVGFWGHSRLGRGILWWSSPIMQTNEWSVCSVCHFSQTQTELSHSELLGDGTGGITVVVGGEWCSGYTPASKVLILREHFWVYVPGP